MHTRTLSRATHDPCPAGRRATSCLRSANRSQPSWIRDYGRPFRFGVRDALGPQTFGTHEELVFLGREISRSQDYSDDTGRTKPSGA